MSVSSSPSELQVGLIGYGLAGRYFHAPFITTTPGLKLAAVMTSNGDRQAQARADHPGVEVSSSLDEFWLRPRRLDLAVVATPNVSHVPYARAAIDRGVAVLVDKPLAATSAEARQLVADARNKQVLLTVYQNRRWDGDFQTLRLLIAAGMIGSPVRFESRFERWRPTPKAGWRESGAPADAGGLLVDLGSHLIDQALVLFGPATHVYAELDRRRPNVKVDDDAFVALTHASGVRTHLWMSVMAADSAPRFVARGTKAAYVKYALDGQENVLLAGGRPQGPEWGREPEERWGHLVVEGQSQPVPTENGNYGQLYAELARALRGDGPPPVDPNDSLAVLEIIEAARRSANERVVVELET